MKLIIKGDKENNYNGIFIAEFTINEEIHKLYYDLDDWDDMVNSGNFGAEYVQYVSPKPLQLFFDKYYELEIEHLREIYSILTHHGWTPLTKEKK